MKERFAVLDLGSNTFHLLIVEPYNDGFKEVFRKREYTKLGKGGSKIILPESFKSGIDCLLNFKNLLSQYKVKSYKAIGTAALRTASNGADFLAVAKNKIGINIALIDGKKEASYIAQGVVEATKLNHGYQWIMDIGGGSVEFILLENGNAIWKESYKIGLGILKARFHKSEPISDAELDDLARFLKEQLTELVKKSNEYQVKTLIGASGSFEVIQHMLDLPKWNTHSYHCHVLDFHKIKEQILSLGYNDRLKVKGLPPERVDLIVVALKLMDYILKNCQIEELIISDYAMKEGIIREHYSNF